MTIRLSANLGFLWADRPLLERVDAAAAAGFPAVEMHWPYDVPAAELRARVERHRLILLGLNTPLGNLPGDFGTGAVPGREAEFAAGFAQALAYAREAGAGAIHVMAGCVPKEERARGRLALIDNLRRIAPVAAAAGITILLEPINRHDKPDYFYDDVDDAAAIIAAVGHAAVSLMFDVYHVGMTGGDAVALFDRHLPLIGHVQVAAVPSRAEPDEGSSLDYAAMFRHIAHSGYRGWVGCEYRPRAGTDEGLGWRAMLGA
jgi:hydroxypyruvate isomerase